MARTHSCSLTLTLTHTRTRAYTRKHSLPHTRTHIHTQTPSLALSLSLSCSFSLSLSLSLTHTHTFTHIQADRPDETEDAPLAGAGWRSRDAARERAQCRRTAAVIAGVAPLARSMAVGLDPTGRASPPSAHTYTRARAHTLTHTYTHARTHTRARARIYTYTHGRTHAESDCHHAALLVLRVCACVAVAAGLDRACVFVCLYCVLV